MRGKLPTGGTVAPIARITPAGAGKTRLIGVDIQLRRDHPRRCGENLHVGFPAGNRRGSPPQVRGKLYVAFLAHYKSRITPAGAGKTTMLAIASFFIRDHPRRCGENFLSVCILLCPWGSPPQVRGKHVPIPRVTCSLRITPAGAGKTALSAECVGIVEDHPRRCGENRQCRRP